MQPSAGVSLKPPHFSAAAHVSADGLWFEIHAENHFVAGGPRLAWLEPLRADRPLAVHGVGLSLASVEARDRAHLGLLRGLYERLEPLFVTEHLAWSRWQGVNVPDLLPVSRTQESLSLLCAHIDAVQDALGRRIALENPSHYLALLEHSWDEVDFLAELVARSGPRPARHDGRDPVRRLSGCLAHAPVVGQSAAAPHRPRRWRGRARSPPGLALSRRGRAQSRGSAMVSMARSMASCPGTKAAMMIWSTPASS